MTELETKRYIGLADCHGIEYFHEEGSSETWNFGMLDLRAGLNPHRHAVAFGVDLTDKEAKLIKDRIAGEYGDEDGRFTDALHTLKGLARAFWFTAPVEKSERLFRSIPDPALDPHHEEDD